MTTRARAQAATFVATVVVWMALWGEWSVANLITGLAVAAVITALLRSDRATTTATAAGRFRPLAAARFLVRLAVDLVRANIEVAGIVCRPGDHTRPGIVAVTVPGITPTVLTIMVAAIGITPGTVVIDLDEDADVLYVHGIRVRDADALRARVSDVAQLAMAAFGPAAGSGAGATQASCVRGTEAEPTP